MIRILTAFLCASAGCSAVDDFGRFHAVEHKVEKRIDLGELPDLDPPEVDSATAGDAASAPDLRNTDGAMVDLRTLPDLVCSGPCTPGAMQQGACDSCSHQVCGNNCQWGACQLKAGNACEYRGGMNNRVCTCTMPCSFDGQNHVSYAGCLSSCQWDTACVCAVVNTAKFFCN